MENKILNRIGMSLLLIGILNLYNIIKYGIEINIPGQIIKIGENNKIEKLWEEGIIKIEENKIKILIISLIVIIIIFNTRPNIIHNNNKINTMEYELLIGLGILGIIIILLSKELITLYLGLELYSFTVYILILVKESKMINKFSIIYLILSSLASAIILYSIAIIYNSYNVLDLDIITLMNLVHPVEENIKMKILYLLTIGILFKLGTIPFSYWIVRLYIDLDKRILWYQLTIPKLIMFLLLIKFISIFYTPKFSFHSSIIYIENNNNFPYFLYIIACGSIIFGTIGGLFQIRDRGILAYSSILNIGIILLSLSLIILYNTNPSNYNIESIINKGFISNPKLWIIYQYFIVYIIGLIGIFSALFLYSKSSLIFNLRDYYHYPFFFSSFILLIFSFIGLPPFSGFFSKFYILLTLFSTPLLTYLSYTIFILSTLISSFFYFKFLFSSSTSLMLSDKENKETYIISIPGTIKEKNEYFNIHFASLILSISTLFSLLYPFLLSYLIPLYYLYF